MVEVSSHSPNLQKVTLAVRILAMGLLPKETNHALNNSCQICGIENDIVKALEFKIKGQRTFNLIYVILIIILPVCCWNFSFHTWLSHPILWICSAPYLLPCLCNHGLTFFIKNRAMMKYYYLGHYSFHEMITLRERKQTIKTRKKI